MWTLEYALIAALIAVAAIGLLTVSGETFHNVFQAVATFFEG